MIRWALRMFRREWRQQLLVLGMLILAVAATVLGAGVATNTPPPSTAGFGTATASVTLPGSDPRLAARIAALHSGYGAADVIENQQISTGSTQQAYLRAQDPQDAFGQPLLRLDSGQYPAGAGQVALTQSLATLYAVHVGGIWHEGGRSYRVTGIVENPTNLLDEFALVAPGQLSSPGQVTVLLDARSTLSGLPAGAVVAFANQGSAGASLSPATIVLVIAVVHFLWIQLPPSLGPTGVDVLAGFLSRLPREHRYCVEVRHRAFFEDPGSAQRLEAALGRVGAEWVTFDTTVLFQSRPVSDAEREAWRNKPRLPRRPRALTSYPVVRYIGRDDPAQTVAGWQPWLATVTAWLRAGRSPTVFIHTPDNVEALDLARRLHADVRARMPEVEPLPEPVPAGPPTLF